MSSENHMPSALMLWQRCKDDVKSLEVIRPDETASASDSSRFIFGHLWLRLQQIHPVSFTASHSIPDRMSGGGGFRVPQIKPRHSSLALLD